MREAREAAGMSLRNMAKQLGYHSHTTLSSYERGAVMPTDEVVSGYERVLDLTPGSLGSVLEGARIERHGDAWAKRRVHLPVEFASHGSDNQRRGGADGRPRGQPRRRLWWAIASGVGVIVIAAGVTFGLLLSSRAPQPVASKVSGVRDGSDPTVTGCVDTAATASSVRVYDPPEHLIGIFQLRSSTQCGTSWGRFVPVAGLAQRPPLRLDVKVIRPADGASSDYHVTFDGLDAYGNMLFSDHQCVYAQLTFNRKRQPSHPAVQTACVKS